jgi:acyl-CoA reductase-like NAD-dependent aldehyde dehydrogenase
MGAQRAAYRALPMPSLETRLAWLKTLEQVMRDRTEDIVEAIHKDFSARSRHETLVGEVFGVLSTIDFLRSELAQFMRPRARPISWIFQPARGEVRHQPKGVVGVISPWNYPIYLSLPVIATALAAGNRVMLKPSELTPHTSALLVEMLSVFPDDLVAVVEGGVETGQAFSRMPWDHLFYTGSTSVGRKVLTAAAANLVPCTLELGGKSPTIVHRSFPLGRAARRLTFGKMYNAGQTCIAPDYALVPRGLEQAFVDAVAQHATQMYPTLAENPDYSAVINDHHRTRLRGMLADAEAKGATLVEVNPAGEDLSTTGKLPLTMVLGATEDMAVLQDEIFGPILPVLPYDTLSDALDYVADRPRPLALYYFDRDRTRQADVLARSHSGGACINDVVIQVAQESMPFGGIGASGMGSYHGIEGLETFSHRKSVLHQPRLNSMFVLEAPYGFKIRQLLRLLVGRS